MEIKLTIIGGKSKKSRVTVKIPATIGRSSDADLTIAHPTVSRQHCRLFEIDGLLRIRDMGSLNGTLVSGEPVTEAPLRPRDEFTVGPVTFRVDYEYGGEDTEEGPRSLARGGAEAPAELDAVDLVAENLTILPDDAPALDLPAKEGQLPDFNAWDEKIRQTQPRPKGDEGMKG